MWTRMGQPVARRARAAARTTFSSRALMRSLPVATLMSPRAPAFPPYPRSSPDDRSLVRPSMSRAPAMGCIGHQLSWKKPVLPTMRTGAAGAPRGTRPRSGRCHMACTRSWPRTPSPPAPPSGHDAVDQLGAGTEVEHLRAPQHLAPVDREVLVDSVGPRPAWSRPPLATTGSTAGHRSPQPDGDRRAYQLGTPDQPGPVRGPRPPSRSYSPRSPAGPTGRSCGPVAARRSTPGNSLLNAAKLFSKST